LVSKSLNLCFTSWIDQSPVSKDRLAQNIDLLQKEGQRLSVGFLLSSQLHFKPELSLSQMSNHLALVPQLLLKPEHPLPHVGTTGARLLDRPFQATARLMFFLKKRNFRFQALVFLQQSWRIVAAVQASWVTALDL